jgi:hypothetical protein
MYKVLTQKGIVPVNKLLYGDKVYEYGTNRMLEVKSLIETQCDKSIKIIYSDGRIEMYFCNEDTLIRSNIKKACELSKADENIPIPLCGIEFNPGKVKEPLYPDPYTAAALLIYGDFSEEYLNYPLNRVEANCVFSHKYNVDYFPLIKRNKVYFQWKGKETDHRITWAEFFPKYDFYAKTKCGDSPAIPYDYMFASLKDRIQFIRGAFDMGYNKNITPESVSINHWSKDRLEWLQWIIRSTGIPCEIKDFGDQFNDLEKRYQLNISGRMELYPGFFYWIEYLEQMISYDQEHIFRPRVQPFKIKKIEVINEPCISYIPILERKALFMSSQFIPHISW